MSGFKQMSPAEDAAANVKTLNKAKNVYCEWSYKANLHENAAQREKESAENYRRRLQILREKFEETELHESLDSWLQNNIAGLNEEERSKIAEKDK